MKLTTKEYKEAIRNALSSRQIEILAILYACPNSAATAKELTRLISPTSDEFIIANRVIGKIGKTISNYLGKYPEPYDDGHKQTPAYFSVVGPYTPSLGWQMTTNLKKALESLEVVEPGRSHTSKIQRLSTETLSFDEQRLYKEGKLVQVFVDRYERNSQARKKCIQYYGDSCVICGFNFGDVYGTLAKGVIEVHHLRELSEIKSEYSVDPIKDLIPVCSNCHTVLHLMKPSITPRDIKSMIKRTKTKRKA